MTEMITGKQGNAQVFTTNNKENALDEYARKQLQMICDHPVAKNSAIRVMPDVHPGKVGTIGLTMTVGDCIMPNLVGIDIGCGMSLVQVKAKKIEYQKMDTVIRENIPSGSSIRKKAHMMAESFDFSRLYCYHAIRRDSAERSLGTLGGGNHFIEADQGADGAIYLVVHSGSRHLGKEVTEYYLDLGQKEHRKREEDVPYELVCLEGKLMEEYLHDVQLVQEYAALNREIMLTELMKGMKLKALEQYDCIHNYIDAQKETVEILGAPVLRKGAISAREGQRVIIPINMRDGIILGHGRGNAEWNLSAPHGSGRVLKREDVAARYTVSSFKAEMKGIYSSCIGKDTLDEAPFAYRPLGDILEVIEDTVSVEQVIKPIYNFKAGDGSRRGGSRK